MFYSYSFYLPLLSCVNVFTLLTKNDNCTLTMGPLYTVMCLECFSNNQCFGLIWLLHHPSSLEQLLFTPSQINASKFALLAWWTTALCGALFIYLRFVYKFPEIRLLSIPHHFQSHTRNELNICWINQCMKS